MPHRASAGDIVPLRASPPARRDAREAIAAPHRSEARDIESPHRAPPVDRDVSGAGVGPHRVGAAGILPTREATAMRGGVVPRDGIAAHAQGAAPGGAPPRDSLLRLLEPAEPAEVEQRDGVPAALWWRGRRQAIARAAGPERLSGGWWGDEGYARDYWRCEAEAGELLLVLDGRARAWYVLGWYD
jgi:hypothetical protein